MRLTFRRRLTLWFLALLAVILLLFGFGVYFGLRAVLYEQFDEQAHTQAELVSASVQATAGQIDWDQSAIDSFQDDDNFVRIVNGGGALLLDSSSIVVAAPYDPATYQRVLSGETVYALDSTATETLGVVSMPIDEGEDIVGMVQVGVSRGDADEVLRNLLIVLAIGLPLALLLGAVGSWMMAGRAISPVSTITNLAAAIEGEDLSTRLDLDLPDDELGRLAQTFDQMLDRIADAFERQRRFTADAAHELRNPLAILQARAEQQLTTGESPDRIAWEQSAADIERMRQIVAALLTLARSDADEMQLDLETFGLATSAALVAEQFEPAAAAKGLELGTDTTPTQIEADQDRLLQVIINLVDNAIANCSAGDTIELGVAQVGDSVKLWVSDTGIGIPESELPFIFDRFYRVETGRGSVQPGAGLGLSICQAIISAHGGEIQVESEVGVGSRFEVTLPASSPIHPGK